MSETDKDINKHAIGKKEQIEAETAAEEPGQDKQEDNVEIPLNKILMAVVVIAIIALAVFGISRLVKPGLPAGSSGVEAYVNGEPINVSTITKSYEAVPATQRALISRESILNQTIAEVVVKQEIAKRGITVDQASMDNMLKSIKDQFPDEGQFNQTLALQGLTYDDLVSQIRLKLSFNKLLQQDLPELRVNDSEISAFFDSNKEKLGTPEQVRASHILVNTSAEADAIEKQLAAGADFAALAKNKSIDPGSAVMGGDLGYFGRGAMIPEFENASFSMKVGEISAPLKTRFGYHIIKVTDKKPAKAAVLDDTMKMIIEQYLFNNKWDLDKDNVNAYINGLRAKANVVIVGQK